MQFEDADEDSVQPNITERSLFFFWEKNAFEPIRAFNIGSLHRPAFVVRDEYKKYVPDPSKREVANKHQNSSITLIPLN